MILLVCGPPGVGKTTVSALLRDRLRERGVAVRLLDSDEFGRRPYERMFAQVADSAPDEHWILAGTFYKRRFWTPFERLDGVVVVHLHADLETCLARNRRREAPIDETGVHVVWREFDPPDADLRVDVTDLSPRAVVDRVVAALEALPDDVRPAGLARRDG